MIKDNFKSFDNSQYTSFEIKKRSASVIKKLILLLFIPICLLSGCAQIPDISTTKGPSVDVDTLADQKNLVKKLTIQQQKGGGFRLCSEKGVWKCKEVTKKTVITSSIVTKAIVYTTSKGPINSDTPTKEVLNEEWLIQVGAYKTEGAVQRALDALILMGVGYVQEKAGDLTLVRVTGFLTKEDALRGLSDYEYMFKNPFVLKIN